jgi:hypothetical protein
MGDRTESRAAPLEGGQAPETDRRDSQRVPIALLVRDAALGGSFEERIGNLSLGGVFFESLHPPVGSRLEVRFMLSGAREEIRATCEVLRVSREGTRFGVHLRFLEIPLDAELAVARFLQQGPA